MDEAIKYVNSINVEPGKVVFSKEFDEVEEKIGDLLQDHLSFNPYLRKTARDLI